MQARIPVRPAPTADKKAPVGRFPEYNSPFAQALIPTTGAHIFAASLNSARLAAKRLGAELDRGETYRQARITAFGAALIPITHSVFTVELVSLPGMMAGQNLSGVLPLLAARYQIMVMCMMFGAAGLSTALFFIFLKKRMLENEVLPGSNRTEQA